MTEERTIMVSAWALREMMSLTRPSLFTLYSAAWRSGFTVNGIVPHG